MKNLKKIFSISVLIVIIALFTYYIYTHLADFRQISLVKPSYIILLMVLTLISSILIGLQTKFLLKPFKINLKFVEWFGLSVTTTFYNMITPFKGGMLSRAAYLKHKHNFPYTHFLATLSGSYVIIFFLQSLLGFTSMLLLYHYYNIFNPIVLAIFLIFLLPLTSIILLSPKFPQTGNKWIDKIIEVANCWHTIRNNKNVILITMATTLCQLIIGTIGTMITYSIIGIYLPVPKALFMISLGALSILISITPASLGIAETVSVFSGLVIGITPAQSLTASIISRIIGMSVIFILGPIFSYLLLKKN